MSPTFSVSDFVAVFNQTIDYVYPSVTIVGELANFRISKGKWVYFDLKDESASVRFFGTIYALPGPLEDGMMVQVIGSPKLHQTFGFSVTVKNITPVGEGSIKKAIDLLKAKLAKEGLFDEDRKRRLPYPPARIGLIASGESAAYKDFLKILTERWGGVEIVHADVQVQGEVAPMQIVEALTMLNTIETVEVIIMTRGGGSADDLQAFSNEQVVRAVSNSRTPTMVAIGHEVDMSLSELAADQRASTPSNAAELLVPSKHSVFDQIETELKNSFLAVVNSLQAQNSLLQKQKIIISHQVHKIIEGQLHFVHTAIQILHGYDPRQILARGYAMVRKNESSVMSVKKLSVNDSIIIQFIDGNAHAKINTVQVESK